MGACSRGTRSCVCVCAQGSVWRGGGADRGAAGGERDGEAFERRQTLPLSTLTPTISRKKAVNPLLPGQARGKVSANSQLPSLPRLMPFGQVNNFIATGPLLRAPAFAGSFPKAPRVSFLPGGLPEAEGLCLCGQRGGETREEGGTRGKTVTAVKGVGAGSTRAPWGRRRPGARRRREGEAGPGPVPPRRGPPGSRGRPGRRGRPGAPRCPQRCGPRSRACRLPRNAFPSF